MGLVPSLGLSLASTSIYRGRLVTIPIIRGTLEKYKSLMERSLPIEGSKLFNAMPGCIRNHTGSKESFKIVLDKFLSQIPDKPGGPDLISNAVDDLCQPTNSIKHWVRTLGLSNWVPNPKHNQPMNAEEDLNVNLITSQERIRSARGLPLTDLPVADNWVLWD